MECVHRWIYRVVVLLQLSFSLMALVGSAFIHSDCIYEHVDPLGCFAKFADGRMRACLLKRGWYRIGDVKTLYTYILNPMATPFLPSHHRHLVENCKGDRTRTQRTQKSILYCVCINIYTNIPRKNFIRKKKQPNIITFSFYRLVNMCV